MFLVWRGGQQGCSRKDWGERIRCTGLVNHVVSIAGYRGNLLG